MKIKLGNQLLLLFPSFFLFCYLTCFANGTTIGRNPDIMCIEHERAALLQFKRGIQVDRCGLLSSWDDHEDNRNCCKWHGVACSNDTGHVTMLDLRGFAAYEVQELCLQGKVGSSLVDLKYLRYLDLSSNYFQGQHVPSFIGSLVNLQHLNLSNTGIKGEIPYQFGNLSNLTSLDLTCDAYPLFKDIYVKNLSWLLRLNFLRSLSLNGVDLSKATNGHRILSSLPYLKVLKLASCKLPPIVPQAHSYQNSSTTLSVLSLSENTLNDSTIFGWLFNLRVINTHLTFLDLSFNRLKGPLPSSFANLQSLSYLSLSGNLLEGPIPDTISTLKCLTHLTVLDLSSNQLKGPLPSSFASLQSLSYLSLSGNLLEGPIPDTISTLKSLTYLDLSDNKFQSLPKTLGNLCSLQQIELQRNNFTDELPNIIQTLARCANKSLSHLDLSYNQIWGSVPHLISTFSSLRYLNLRTNRLNGTVDQSIGKLSKMETLDVSSNFLEGTISDIHFSNLFHLKELSLGNNSGLALNISLDWVPPFQLVLIDLSSCRIGPVFPRWLLSQTNFSFLDISNAGISDSIPKSFNLLPSNLGSLNVSHNNINGTLEDLTNLNFHPLYDYIDITIDLSFNNIEGAIPSFPSHVVSILLNNNRFSNPVPLLCPDVDKNLSNLDLSNNLLSGALPDCWMRFPLLSILHLENNNFSGALPPSFGHLKQIKSLHLRNNTISGRLPRSFENLTSLVILDLGYNSLSGHIPPSIGSSFKSLSILSLQSNSFDGNIPLTLCHLSFLQVLDLSSNHITGTIPKCMHNFTAMKNGTDFLPELDYSGFDDGYYEYADAATFMWKRKEWSFKNTLGLVKAIDISENELEGDIPTELSFLEGLGSLNMSGNNLVGEISPRLGQLVALEILDLSRNKFSGGIPTSFVDLNSLGILDLSNNNLSGEIPNIPQLQRFDASSYMGNPGLCGLPLPKCPWDQPPENNPSKEDNNAKHKDQNENEDAFTVGLYVSVVLGFIIGFWGVCGTLVLKRSWRHAFFRFLDDVRGTFISWFQ